MGGTIIGVGYDDNNGKKHGTWRCFNGLLPQNEYLLRFIRETNYKIQTPEVLHAMEKFANWAERDIQKGYEPGPAICKAVVELCRGGNESGARELLADDEQKFWAKRGLIKQSL